MKLAAFGFATLLLAGSALAQDAITTTPTPDFSKPTLIRILRPEEVHVLPEHGVHWYFGSFEFGALGMLWRIKYLPFAAPLPGSVRGTTHVIPDAFTLNGTEFASTPRNWNTQRQLSSEMRRIERLTKKQANVKATPE